LSDFPDDKLQVKPERKTNFQNYTCDLGQNSVRYEEQENGQNKKGNSEIKKVNYNEYKNRKHHDTNTKLRIEKFEKQRNDERTRRMEAAQYNFQNILYPFPPRFSTPFLPDPNFGLTPLGPFTPGLLAPRHSTRHMLGVRLEDPYSILPSFER
jgi:hypothetical protein